MWSLAGASGVMMPIMITIRCSWVVLVVAPGPLVHMLTCLYFMLTEGATTGQRCTNTCFYAAEVVERHLKPLPPLDEDLVGGKFTAPVHKMYSWLARQPMPAHKGIPRFLKRKMCGWVVLRYICGLIVGAQS